MVRTYLVTGSSSEVGALVCTKLLKLGNRVIRIDAHGGDINCDFSTPSGRLEAAEKVLELTGGQIDAIISTADTHVNKPIAISNNFYGITQFINALIDELKRSPKPRISILNLSASSDEVSSELINAILHSTEKKSLKLAQQILELTPNLAFQNYTSSQKALREWVVVSAKKGYLRRKHILLNAVSNDSKMSANDIANLLIWLAGTENKSHTGEVFTRQSLAELSLTS